MLSEDPFKPQHKNISILSIRVVKIVYDTNQWGKNLKKT